MGTMSPEAKKVALLLEAATLSPETIGKLKNASTTAEIATILSSITISESDITSYDNEVQSLSDDELKAASGGEFWSDFGEGAATGATITGTAWLTAGLIK